MVKEQHLVFKAVEKYDEKIEYKRTMMKRAPFCLSRVLFLGGEGNMIWIRLCVCPLTADGPDHLHPART